MTRLNELLHKAIESQGVRQFFANSGGEVFPTSPAELVKFQASETEMWGRVIKAAGIEAE